MSISKSWTKNEMETLNILLIEDNPGDARLVKELLSESALINYELVVAETLKKGIEQITANLFDIVLLDLNLPDSNGEHTFEAVVKVFPHSTILLISSLYDTELSLKLIKMGAEDYLHKSTLDVLSIERSIRHSIERSKLRLTIKTELDDRIKAQEELKKQNAILHAILNRPESILIFQLDKNYQYLGFNENHKQEMKRVSGIDIKTGMNFLDLFTSREDRERAKAGIDRALQGETVIGFESDPILKLYYEYFWNSIEIDEKIVGVCCFLIDITERKLFESLLQQSEERFRHSFEYAAASICLVGLDFRFQKVNNAFIEMLGYSENELKQMFITGITHPEDKTIGMDYAEQMLDLKIQIASFEKRYIKKDGGVIWGHVSMSLVRDVNDVPSFFVVQITDITKQKQAEKDLIEAKEDAEVMNRLKSNLLANMSHEMRTPLISILGYSELIQEEKVKPEIKMMANNINLGGTRLLTTLDNLLQFSKIEAENYKPNLFEVNIIHTLKDVIYNFTKSIEKKGLKLVTKFESDNLIGFLDDVLLTEVFTNLIENAIKFTVKGNIMISTNTNKESLIITIADTGVGIPVEKQKLIFEEFRQVSEGISRGYEGTGLGLTIAQNFVKLMNGEISVESEVDRGSTFIIKFPNQHLNPDEVKVENVQKDVKSVITLPNILYVEDDLITVDVIEKYMEKVGIMEIAETGEIALEKIALKHYDIILVDINLGYGMNGKEFTRLVREMPLYKNTPIIAVTAYAMLGDRGDCLAAGCSDYISKPFRRQKLVDMVKSALNPESLVND